MVLGCAAVQNDAVRTGADEGVLDVGGSRVEARRVGAECRGLGMTPLLLALFDACLPERVADRGEHHTRVLHDLLRFELRATKEVPLTISLPEDKRVKGLALAALEDPSSVESVEAWLSNAAASRKTIERVFIAQTGMPPSRWLRHAKVLHAISQLSSGEKIGSIAFSMGYESASAFSYMFRSTLGFSPSAFSRTFKGQ